MENFDASQNCGGVTLPPAGRCEFDYEFGPASLGPKTRSTTIDVNDDSFAVTLFGIGVTEEIFTDGFE